MDSQAAADALVGVLVKGSVTVTAAVNLRDFGVEAVGTPTVSEYLINVPNAVNGGSIKNVSLDCKNNIYTGGLNLNTGCIGWTLERIDCSNFGSDALRIGKSGYCHHNYIHSARPWVDAVDGTYDGDIHPHQDGVQSQRSGNHLEYNWIDMGGAHQSSSALMVHNGAEQITSFFGQKNYFNGGDFPVHTHPENTDVNDPGPWGYPENVVYRDNLFGRDSLLGNWSDQGTPSANISRSGNTFLDNGERVPNPPFIPTP